MSTFSLRHRLLIAATLTFFAFLGLAGVALDRAFISSSKVTVKNQLKTQINALLTVLEISDQGALIIPDRMPETRLTMPSSGLYSVILSNDGQVLWRSKSSLGIGLNDLRVARPGEEIFSQTGNQISSPFFYSFGIAWEIDLNRYVELSLVMIDESRNYTQTISSHRKELIFWLGTAGIFLLIMQGVILRWGLKPLKAVANELDMIEHAQQKTILGNYPKEIAQLSRRINIFIENERKNLTRYRDTLGDLAHSLKTPLAVIKGMTDNDKRLNRENLDELVDRMNKIVEYQLKRASSSQFSVMHSAVNCEEVLEKLNSSMNKVYADKQIQCIWNIDSDSVFYGDESDLFEFLGNIIDNAYKWADSRVQLTATVDKVSGKVQSGLIIEIHDDGPGIPLSERDLVLNRGVRADQQTPGQGIGLAVVREIVARYEGVLTIETSHLGGALVRAIFPAS